MTQPITHPVTTETAVLVRNIMAKLGLRRSDHDRQRGHRRVRSRSRPTLPN